MSRRKRPRKLKVLSLQERLSIMTEIERYGPAIVGANWCSTQIHKYEDTVVSLMLKIDSLESKLNQEGDLARRKVEMIDEVVENLSEVLGFTYEWDDV